MAAKTGVDSRLRWLLVLFLGFAAFMMVRFAGVKTTPGKLEKPSLAAGGRVGLNGFDAAWNLTDLNGKTVAFESYKGKPIFLNIWGTWCDPCLKEMPSISALARNKRVSDYVFLCVAVSSEAADVKTYAEANRLSTTVLSAESLPAVFKTEGIPATFVVDRSGRIVLSHIGAASWDDPDVIDQLEKLASKGK